MKKSSLNFIFVFAAMLAVVALAGCSPKTPKARAVNAKSANTPSVQKASWNWDSYPAMLKMRIANLPCQLQPKSILTVQSPLNGVLRVYVNTPQTNLPAGFMWGEFEPEIFAMEEKSLAEAEKKITEREKLQYEIELPKQKMA